jgi:hypothetical protein
MEFSTEAVQQMAEIMVSEMGKIGLEGKGIREVETGMREFLRVVGNAALGKYLEQKVVASKFLDCVSNARERVGLNRALWQPLKRALLGSVDIGIFWLPNAPLYPWLPNNF